MPTYAQPKERNTYTTDIDGTPLTTQSLSDVARHTIDWTDELDSGETISTSTWDGSGVTLSAAGSTSTTTYVTVTGAGGAAKNTVTTTGGAVARTLVKYLHISATPSGIDLSDYR